MNKNGNPLRIYTFLLMALAAFILLPYRTHIFADQNSSNNSGQCPAGWIGSVGSAPYQFFSNLVIGKVGIKAGNQCFLYTNSGDDCYRITGINSTNVLAEKIGIGKGDYCQDISHVVFYAQES
ncbi:MAG TPA: hypothetical protein VF828_00750, partial [Patescibacteria group bacterium]